MAFAYKESAKLQHALTLMNAGFFLGGMLSLISCGFADSSCLAILLYLPSGIIMYPDMAA